MPPEESLNQMKSWDGLYNTGVQVNYTCIPGSQTEDNQTLQVISCQDLLGWIPAQVQPCFCKYKFIF